MSKLLVTDELWELVEPLLPTHRPGPKGGKPRVADRVCLTGILRPASPGRTSPRKWAAAA